MIQIGDSFIFNSERYFVSEFLGKGKSGYSFLISNGSRKLVLKILHDEPCSYYNFYYDKLESEINAYGFLKKTGIKIPALYGFDKNENYLVKDYIDGRSAAKLISENEISENDIKQIFEISKILFSYKINIDYFPMNFVKQNSEFYYVDYEFNKYSDEWNFENWGIYYWLNNSGMKEFLETGNHMAINLENSGKPVFEPFKKEAERLINKFGIRSTESI